MIILTVVFSEGIYTTQLSITSGTKGGRFQPDLR